MRFRSLVTTPTCLLVASTLWLSACSSWRTPAEQRSIRAKRANGDIVVAGAWPWQTRKEMHFGEGLDLAIDEVNQGNGVNGRRLRLLRVEDHESVNEGQMAAQQIANDPDIVAVIGHLQSFVTVPAAAVYDLSGLILVSPAATDAELTSHGYRRLFRTTFTGRSVGRQIAEFAGRRALHRVAIMYVRNTYGRELANAFEERASEVGVTIAARRSYDPGNEVNERTFEPVVNEWKNVPMDAIFVAGEVPSAGYFITKARSAGLNAPILGGDAMGGPWLMSVSGAAAEGAIVGGVFHPDEPRPEVRQFAKLFSDRYHVPPDWAAAAAYDAINLLARAMREARSSDPGEVAAALHAAHDWPGVTGPFSFNEAGDAIDRHLVKLIVRHGRLEHLPDPAPGLAAMTIATEAPRR